MTELTITEDQHERLAAIRDDIEAAYVDTYGHTRLEDAIEYLLDTYTPPDSRESAEAYDRIATAEYPELQRIASDIEGIPGSGIDADEMRGRLLSELGPDALAAELADTTQEDSDVAEAIADDSETATTDSEEADSQGQSEDTAVGSLLSTANKLLDEHEEKWHESDDETPYEVDLPDGTTKPARTKDDVRQLLFRHY